MAQVSLPLGRLTGNARPRCPPMARPLIENCLAEMIEDRVHRTLTLLDRMVFRHDLHPSPRRKRHRTRNGSGGGGGGVGEWCGSGWASWGVRHEMSGTRREVVWWWVGVWCVVVGG
jgi:hypothetical protein